MTDLHELAALGAVRSLGKAGHCVIGACPSRFGKPAGVFSRYLRGLVACPDSWKEQFAFRDWLLREAGSGQYDVILPASEASIFAALSLRSRFPAHVLLLMPKDNHLRFTLSKYEATHAAAESGVKAPATVFLVPNGERSEWCTDELAEISYPRIVKTDNVLDEFTGEYLKSRSYLVRHDGELQAVLDECHSLGMRTIVQEFVPGQGVGAFFLRYWGRYVLSFAHQRLHSVPYSGGWSSLRRSIRDQSLIGEGKRLLDSIDYEGVAMVEFRRAVDGTLYFLEINGRLWGSLALALHAGVDFPAAWVECALSDGVLVDRAEKPYIDGILCANLFPGEIGHLISVFKAGPHADPPPRPSKLGTFLDVFFHTLDPRVRRDFFQWRDPGPAFLQLWKLLRYTGASALTRAHKLIMRVRIRRLLRAIAANRRGSNFLPKHVARIAFLCAGNLCRSPFAERLFVKKAREKGLGSIEVASAGLSARAGVPTPKRFVELFSRHGLDPSEHKAKPVTRDLVQQADVLILMDHVNLMSLAEMYPEALPKARLLGNLLSNADQEIADPYVLGPLEATESFQAIARAIDRLIDVLRDCSSAPPEQRTSCRTP